MAKFVVTLQPAEGKPIVETVDADDEWSAQQAARSKSVKHSTSEIVSIKPAKQAPKEADKE